MACKWHQCVDITRPVPKPYTVDDFIADALDPVKAERDPATAVVRFAKLTARSVWCRLRRRWGLGR